jgi:hypothetical protein
VLPVAAGNPALSAPLEHGMGGDLATLLEDVHLPGQRMHLDGAPAGAIGHAVEIAADGDHAIAGDAPLQPQHRLERPGRQRLEAGALLGEMNGDDAPCGGVHAGVGVLVEPPAQLLVQVIEIAEAAGEEEVLVSVFAEARILEPRSINTLDQVDFR